ncbi:U3 small nucleolar RNA-associated protein 25, putative [Plasmodium ovale]|uniref:U3 small nucleolar RNA-associated protein 25, putative n=1 Tax=Plasmodium ovale TaxID=36330 RepID=A0A1D3TGF7_PLAOA|nr:U3 small nucleolar RNA-associated protein 25, putative [Plasmodium ovale]
MGIRRRRGKRRVTSLSELYELEYVKREKKKKFKQLMFHSKKGEAEGEAELEMEREGKGEVEKEGKLDSVRESRHEDHTNQILQGEYSKLKAQEYGEKDTELPSDKEEKNKTNYVTFLQILKKKKGEIVGDQYNEKIDNRESDICEPSECATLNTQKKKDEERDGGGKWIEEKPLDRTSEHSGRCLLKNLDDIYMSVLVKNIKMQSENFIKLINAGDTEKKEDTQVSAKGSNGNKGMASPRLVTFPSYLARYRADNIYRGYTNESYKLSENKMDYYFTFCQNVEERFIEQFCKRKLGKQKEKEENTERKKETIENAYITSNLFLTTNIFKAKEVGSNLNGDKKLSNHRSYDYGDVDVDEVEDEDKDDDCNGDNRVANAGERQFFRGVNVKPFFFSDYLEKNCITYYLINVLDTQPRCLLNEDNPYNVYERIMQNLRSYMSAFKHPLAYFSSAIYTFLQDYYCIGAGLATHRKEAKRVHCHNLSDNAEISEHSERGESSEHSERGESSEHNDRGESSEHNERGESSEHNERGESSEHNERGESGKCGESSKCGDSMKDLCNLAPRRSLEGTTFEGRRRRRGENIHDMSSILGSNELRSYFHYINAYVDVLYSNQNVLNCHFVRLLNSVHYLNHLKKKRKRKKYIRKKIEKLEKEQQVERENVQVKEEYCDESLAKPKILILCAFRYIAKEYVDFILHLLTPTEIKKKKKFISEYDITTEEKKKMKNIYAKKKRTLDYINIYRGNNDDCFRLGIKLLDDEKKIELYSPFFDSDILICSPLGLEIVINERKERSEDIFVNREEYSMDENESADDNNVISSSWKKKKNNNPNHHNKMHKQGKEEKQKKKKMNEYDFLSSIEILIIDQIDIILMQNLLTLKNVLNFINKPLIRWGNININRIPKYVINGYVKNYRQTIITSSVLDTNFISLIQTTHNYRSYLKLFVKNEDYSILINIKKNFNVNQYFKKIDCDHFLKIEDSIINFFSKNVMEILVNIKQLIIFLPTYIEYLRLYELLRKNDISFKGVNEYTNEKKLLKIQKLFKLGRINILLITGRLIFYERCTFKGAHHIIFFSPPKFLFMYFELIKNLHGSLNSSSICYYTKYHTYELERIVGQKKTMHLMREKPGKITLFR